MLTNPMTHFGEGEEQRSSTSLPIIVKGNVLLCGGSNTTRYPWIKQSLLCTSKCTPQ